MTSSSGRASARALRVGIDGRELEGHPTGVGRYLRSLLRRFKDSPHRFIVYSASPVTLPVASERIESRVLRGGHPLLWEQRTLSTALIQDSIDVLLSPAYSCPLVSAVPRVTAIHDLSFFALREEFGFLHGLRRRFMARGAARVSRALLACSQFTKTEVRRHLGARASEKTAVVLLGPDDDLPEARGRIESRASLGVDADTAYIVTVGTVLRRRNVSTLVRALARLQGRGQVRLGVIGENRSRPFEDIGALARQLGCEAAVRVTGFVPDDEVARQARRRSARARRPWASSTRPWRPATVRTGPGSRPGSRWA